MIKDKLINEYPLTEKIQCSFECYKVTKRRYVIFWNDKITRHNMESLLNTFDEELAGLEIASWIKPRGGYFISFDVLPGCAKDVVAKCKALGVILTGAGATYPYGKDPLDSNIRIAPTFPSVEEMEEAAKVFVLCVKLSSVEKLLAEM